MFNIISFCEVLIFLSLIARNDGKLPADIKPCKAADKKCIVEAINKIIETKYQGDPDLNLESIDPLFIKEMQIHQPKNNPVNIEAVFRNGQVIGYKNFRVYKVRGFGANPEGKHDVYLKGPSLRLLGEYSVDGKILILPIKGDGRCNILLDKPIFKVNIDGKTKIKDGVTYMDIKNMNLSLNITNMHIEMTDLFNGDKALGDNLNKFLNENWRDVYVEMERPVQKAFAKVYKQLIGKVFAAHPYKELVEGGD